MASLLLSAGATGFRFSLPNARVMIHQPIGGFHGQATDVEIHAREMLELKKRLNGVYVKHTGNSLSVIEQAVERDFFMDPVRAKEFGLIDKVIEKREDLK